MLYNIGSSFFVLHRLQVIGFLDLSPSLLSHGLLQLLSLACSRDIVFHGTSFLALDIDRLVLQRDLGGEGLEVSFGEQFGFEILLALRG